ncbi:GDP-L-fucose synthase [Gramella lutea]|uniref:GDP-L-fucose synthase n=1 Tax=Christiangramia lutea TaxID=1607951 RepID=A0A9X1V1Y0_9FLAO|nr:GDP-L-fucose synthase [Christiangramia lutea]MCH4822750.1 GDP-L-fucose synthase [Christiangramia lutea]
MLKNSKIYIAGHRGLVGRAIIKRLKDKGYRNFITRDKTELDLRESESVEKFFQKEKPEFVFLAAAKVGGIVANNKYRADFLYENLMIQTNVIHQSYLSGVKKLMFLGSTCIYPKNCPQPIKEEYMLTGSLEYTNEPYAIAKIAGMKMCEAYNLQYGTNFISAMPTNLYGPGDNFDLEKSHVLPALLRKMFIGKLIENKDWDGLRNHLAQKPLPNLQSSESEKAILEHLRKYGILVDEGRVKVEIWGSGKPLREFLWSEDMADACVFLMEKINFSDVVSSIKSKEIRNTHINIGSGLEVSIKELAWLIKEIVGFEGELFFNTDKKDGTMRKVTDTSKLEDLGWTYSVKLTEGIKRMVSEIEKKEFNTQGSEVIVQ